MVRAQLATYAPRKPRDHAYWSDSEPCSMLIDEVEAIWAQIAEKDDWSALHAKVAAVRRMGEALQGSGDAKHRWKESGGEALA
jgi:hypothetical protein